MGAESSAPIFCIFCGLVVVNFRGAGVRYRVAVAARKMGHFPGVGPRGRSVGV